MSKTQLLCTFTKKHRLKETLDKIAEVYDITFGRIYVLENLDDKRELICTYNIGSEIVPDETLRSTISIHRKKNTNTLFTINAINHIVALLNDGKVDPNFEVDWNNYKNTLLVTDDNGLKEIKTKIYDIIYLK